MCSKVPTTNSINFENATIYFAQNCLNHRQMQKKLVMFLSLSLLVAPFECTTISSNVEVQVHNDYD